MAFGAAATAAAHAWADCDGDDSMDFDVPPVLRDTSRSVGKLQCSSTPASSDAFMPSSNAERVAEQVSHPYQKTQSVSSRLNPSAMQARTTSRTARATWITTRAPPRADAKHSVQHERAAFGSSAAGCRSDATARVCADGAAHFRASTGAHEPMHGAPRAEPPPCGAGGSGCPPFPPGLLQLAPWSERLLRAATALHHLGVAVVLRPDWLATLRPAATTASASATFTEPTPTTTNHHHHQSSPPILTAPPLRHRRHRSPCQLRREVRRRQDRDAAAAASCR